MGMDEAVNFINDKRDHFKEGLFVTDDIVNSIEFTESPAVKKCLVGCEMSKNEILKLGGTVFGKVLEEEEKWKEGRDKGNEEDKEDNNDTIDDENNEESKENEEEKKKTKKKKKKTKITLDKDVSDIISDVLSSSKLEELINLDDDDDDEDDENFGEEEEIDDDEILGELEELSKKDESELKLDMSFGNEERDPTESINEPYRSNLEYLKDQFVIIENKILYKVYLNKSKNSDSLDNNKVSPKLMMRECAAKVRATSACVSKRLAKTLETEGVEQPRLEELAKLHNLDSFEKSVLLLLVGMMISEDVRRAWEIENRTYVQKFFTVGSVFSYLCGNLQDKIESRKYFYCSSTLIRDNMVQVSASTRGSVSTIGSDLDECNIEIDRRLFDYM